MAAWAGGEEEQEAQLITGPFRLRRPNACVVEEAGGRRFYSDCKYWRQRDICGQTAVPRYECCEGFEQLPGEPGCAGEHVNTKGVEEVANLVRGAWARAQELPRERLSRLEQAEDPTTRPLLQYHLTDGRVLTSGLPSDHLQDTRLAGRQLRLNKYSSGVQTANCARLVRRDVPASDGVVHLLENVLDPAFASAPAPLDLAQLVATDGRFSALARTIERADFAGRLRSPERPCTLLAPSDEAFQKLSAARLQRILDDEGARRGVIETLETVFKTIGCKARGASVPHCAFALHLPTSQDIICTGVVGVAAKSVLQLLDERGLTTFASLVRSAGLDDAFDSFHDYTVFAPSEAAMFGRSPAPYTPLLIFFDRSIETA
ncbi:Transforming growth factor-beta-induced protein ig-h3 [Gryllus bimaculatus]|nr:Transforming growth factor-beta-induced protein ig-h3 [Gryllus bimaculatus]